MKKYLINFYLIMGISTIYSQSDSLSLENWISKVCSDMLSEDLSIYSWEKLPPPRPRL